MLYSGHLAIVDHFSWKQPNHGQTLVEKPLFSGHFYSRHNLLAPCEQFKPNFLLYSGHPIFFCGEIKINSYSIFKWMNDVNMMIWKLHEFGGQFTPIKRNMPNNVFWNIFIKNYRNGIPIILTGFPSLANQRFITDNWIPYIFVSVVSAIWAVN